MLPRAPIGRNWKVWSAADGTEAIQISMATRIDLVLLDLSLPMKSGWDVLEELKAKNPLLSVIIIAAKFNDAFTSLGAGVGVLLEKPLNSEELLETVSYLLTEPVEAKLDRIKGRRAAFHYLTVSLKGFL